MNLPILSDMNMKFLFLINALFMQDLSKKMD